MPASAPTNEAKTLKTNSTSFADLQRGKDGSSSVSLWTTREEKTEGTIFVIPVKLEEVEVPECRAQWQGARQTLEMRALQYNKPSNGSRSKLASDVAHRETAEC